MSRLSWWFAALMWISPMSMMAESGPLGSEFLVNAQGGGSRAASFGALRSQTSASGGFVVVWHGYRLGGDLEDIQGNIYNTNGSPDDPPVPQGEFGVNTTYTTSNQEFPVVAVASDSSFLVVWQSDGPDGSDPHETSIRVRKFNSMGSPVASEMQVNTYTLGVQSYPDIAVDVNDDFLVVWQSDGSVGNDNLSFSIQGRRVDAGGTPIGSQVQINTYTTSFQEQPAVASDSSGNFVVAWESDGSDGSDTDGLSIQAQKLDKFLVEIGTEFQVNVISADDQKNPSVAIDSDGSFVVAWETGMVGSDYEIRAQKYDSACIVECADFQVNSYTTGAQKAPFVAFGTTGFTIVWDSEASAGTDNSGTSIHGQRFLSSCSPYDPDFQLNEATVGDQSEPSISAEVNGNFVVTWNDGLGVSGRLVSPITGLIFADGFESGDTSAW